MPNSSERRVIYHRSALRKMSLLSVMNIRMTCCHPRQYRYKRKTEIFHTGSHLQTSVFSKQVKASSVENNLVSCRPKILHLLIPNPEPAAGKGNRLRDRGKERLLRNFFKYSSLGLQYLDDRLKRAIRLLGE